MYCRQCGYNNDNYTKICKRCGSMLNESPDEYRVPPSDPGNRVGGLRFAPKKEKLSERISRNFSRLRRVSERRLNKWTVVIAAAVMVLCVAALVIILDIRYKNSITPVQYANDSCNIMQDCFAAQNDEFLFFSSPYGSNPGLYRETLLTGQRLKIAYRTLSCISVQDGWIYGLDEHGSPLRISVDGTVTQYITDDAPLSYFTVTDSYCYYIDADHYMYRIKLDFPEDDEAAGGHEAMNRARPEQICGDRVGCMLLSSDRIFYTTLTMHESAHTENISGGDIRLEPLCSSTGYPVGQLWSIALDGTDAAPILEESVFSMSTKGSYIYFFTESTETVSYTDIYPPSTETTKKTKKTKKKTTTTEPPPKNIDVIRLHSWRYSMRTGGYASFLADDHSISPIYISGDSIYYISKDGNLMTASLSGLDEELIPTDTQKIDHVFELGGYVYFSSSEDELYARIKHGDVKAEVLSSPDTDS